MSLSEIKLAALGGMIHRLPDVEILKLRDGLLAASQAGDASMLDILDSVSGELNERAAAALAVAPLSPLFDAEPGMPPNSAVVRAFANDLRRQAPEQLREATTRLLRLRADDAVPAIFDDLCARAATMLRTGEGDLATLAGVGAPRLARLLALTPVVRSGLCHLPKWITRGDAESQATARLTLKDATGLDADAAPLLIQVFASHLDDPRMVLRIISVMIDRPSDRYLGESELAPFGETLLRDLEDHLARLKGSPIAEGGTMAVAATAAGAIITEFENQFQLAKDGPWGRRIGSAKRALAATAEQRMQDVEPAIAAALPLQPARVAARLTKGVPKLTQDPDDHAVAKACGAARFLAETRSSAPTAGFGSARMAVVERLQDRLSSYVEDLLESLGDSPGDPRVLAYLGVAADIVGLVDGEAGGDIVRRRTTAAMASRAA